MTKVIIVSQIIILLFTFNCSGRTQLIKDNNRPQNLKKVLAERKARKEKIRKSAPFAYGYQQRRVLRRQHRERLRFGLLRHQRKYKRKKLKNTVLEQRSGHKRLYDHNIFLRALFKGRLVFQKKANLAPQFKNGLFVDIGSAILYQDGAPTVRDLYDDPMVSKNLEKIIATDINDTRYAKTRYIEIYHKQKNKLPFPVEEIPMTVTKASQVQNLYKKYDKDQNTGIIFRAASTGPDLFYSTKNLVAHFKAILEATVNRPVIYFFNIFVLYKSPDKDKFTIIGIMDPKVGLNHKYHAWTEINWKRRRLRQAFFADKKFITIINNPKSKKSLHITSK